MAVPIRVADLDTCYVAGLVVPDVPLEETASLRNEAIVHNIELVGPHSHLVM